MSLSADIANAIIQLDTAVADFENALRELGHKDILKHETYEFLKDAIEVMQDTSLGEGQHFDSLEEARASRAPQCWGTTSTYHNYTTGQDDLYEPTCGSTEPHGPHII